MTDETAPTLTAEQIDLIAQRVAHRLRYKPGELRRRDKAVPVISCSLAKADLQRLRAHVVALDTNVNRWVRGVILAALAIEEDRKQPIKDKHSVSAAPARETERKTHAPSAESRANRVRVKPGQTFG